MVTNPPVSLMLGREFSDYVVYADESGDHGLTSVNPQNFVFVLVFCIIEKASYYERIVPSMQRLKFDFWGHDSVIVHSHDIRKSKGDFSILFNKSIRSNFIERINKLIENSPFAVIAAVIDKQRYRVRESNAKNPYEVALASCMGRLQFWLKERGQADRLTYVIVERRGPSEAAKLELEFRRVADGDHVSERINNLAIRFMDKRNNSTGLQLADLVAHPIGRHSIDAGQPNRAFELIEPKLARGPDGRALGYGIKVFP